jgi:glycerol-3-phosphate dehydrogenase
VEAPNEQRKKAFETLARETFDVVVVGGGITGTGIARDAALRGLKVALVEKKDFASGTSSKSSKLVHGGLRYLEMAELGLVFESVTERKRLMRLARHLVRPLPFLVTNYVGDRRWLPTLDVGLWIYDAMTGFSSYRNHRTFLAKKTLALEPTLRHEGLRGGILYYDCLTDDARLTLENALDARTLGATVVNYARAGKLMMDGSERIVGVVVHDEDGGAAVEVRSKVVINATGPWSDEVRAMVGEGPILKPTKGVHVVVDAKRLPIHHALMMTAPRDKRVVFGIPWGLGRTVIGTTDTFFDGSPDKVPPTHDDVEYLLETANRYFPEAKIQESDVISTWSGLRPLLKPAGDAGASQVSREHMIYERPGFVTIAGGKLTTYRRMAAEVVDRAMSQLGTFVKCTTDTRPLPGAEGLIDGDERLEALEKSLASQGLKADASAYLATTYGSRATSLLARTKADPTAAESIDDELPFLAAQVDEAVDVELARTLEDVLVRRVQVLLRSKDQGKAVAGRVADRMAKRLGWSKERTEQELAHYQATVAEANAWRS